MLKNYRLISVFLSLFANVGAVSVATPAATPPFVSDTRWCVLGDSITHGGYYHHYVEEFYLTRFPTRKIDVINCGVGGDTALGAARRISWDCLNEKPTVVSIMLGMNDMRRSFHLENPVSAEEEKRRAEGGKTYDASMRQIIKQITDSGARLILITPSIFDDTAQLATPSNLGCGAALSGFAERVKGLAAESHAPVVDFNGPMTVINEAEQKKDPTFTLVGRDRVHPGAPGHLVMAYTFLKAQFETSKVAEIALEANTGRVLVQENCTVIGVKSGEGAIEFTCTENALPFAVPSVAKTALALVPFTRDLNQETLKISGLTSGTYQLAIDGVMIHGFSAEELGAGVNLADYANTPQMVQSLAVLALLNKKYEAVSKLRTIAATEFNLFGSEPRPEDPAQRAEKIKTKMASLMATQAKIYADRFKAYDEAKPEEAKLRQDADAYVEEARQAAQPKPHHFTLSPSHL